MKKKKSNHTSRKYKARKFVFLFVLLTLILLIFFSFSRKKINKDQRFIRVAVCGCVKKPAVYTMKEYSDLAMLVGRAGGFKLNADVMKVNLDLIVKHDTVYHIPCKKNKNNQEVYKYVKEVNKEITKSYEDLAKSIVGEENDNEIEYYSILYVGIPAVFVLINYYPEFHRINFVHIPHSTVFLNNEYRLIDTFFTLDIYPTMRIIENRLKQRIDYYLIQDRFNFIDKLGVFII